MALSVVEALRIVDTGGAGDFIDRFMRTSIHRQMEISSGLRDGTGFDDDLIVAALALSRVLHIAEVRRTLGLKRRPRGRKIKVEEFGMASPAMNIAFDCKDGLMSRSEAEKVLGNFLAEIGHDDLNEKTISSLLDDFIERAKAQQQFLYRIRDLAGGSHATREDFYECLSAILGNTPPIETPGREGFQQALTEVADEIIAKRDEK